MDGENRSNPAGAAVAEPAGDKGAASPTVQTGAGAPASVSPSGASAGTSEPKTYRDEDVQKIVRERLADEQRKWAPYKELGDPSEVKSRLEKAERYEKAFRGDAPAQPSAEETALRELLDKQGYVRADRVEGIAAQLKAIQDANVAAHANAGRGMIAKLAQEKLGTGDANVLKMLENVISASIQDDKEALKAWNSGDTSVIEKHFENVVSQSFDPLFKSASARYSSGKAKDKAEVPPSMPKGGVQAPVSQDRKMTGEERREAAYKRLMELEGQA